MQPALKRLLKFCAWIVLIMALLVTVVLCFAIDNSPQPVIAHGLNRDDIERAKQLLRLNPEEQNSIKHLTLNAKDLNIALGYLLSHFVENTTAVNFLPGHIIWFQIAIFVPESPWGRYLDLSFTIRQNNQGLYLKSVKIGEISIPDPVANWLIPMLVRHTRLNQYWQLAITYVKEVHIGEQTLAVHYLGTLVDQAKQWAVQKHHDYPSLPFYQQQINDIVLRHDPAWRLSLSELLQPLFKLAAQRSDEMTAIQENRAVIIAIASYVFKNELRRFLPLGLIFAKEYPVFAYKRIDIPQHFIASALVAAVDNKLLSQQLGVDKEVGDSQQGSGFSFIDINSDKSGALFGQLATANPQSAKRIQELAANIPDYTALIPDPQGLPEHMDEATFKQHYERIDSPAYRAMIDDIEHRIAALAIYQNP